ncbi:MAG TPA: CBS domain-containing protein [Burkholderiales bacterium]|nr:CBS domain-containing protein [Burkholderiales bacterium]
MKTVKQILQSKTRGIGILSISPDATVYDALKLMAEKEVGALLVMEADKVVGIISERDYARKVILHGKSSKEIHVSDIMTSKIIYVNTAQTVDECMALMTDKRVRHLPVYEGDRLVGVVSIGDLVKEAISEREYIIKQLESYIMK